jgi:hypothetical protein
VLEFSGDGSRAVSLGVSGGDLRQVVVHDLNGEKPKAYRTNLFFGRHVGLELSRRGDGVAILDGTTLSVYGLPSGELKAAARIPDTGRVLGPLFVDPERVRIHLAREWSYDDEPPGDLRIWELHTGTNGLAEVGRIPEAGDASGIQWHRSSGRGLLARSSEDGWRFAVFEGGDGRVVTTFGRRELDSDARMLVDGRVVHAWSEGGQVRIGFVGTAGEETGSIELGDGNAVALGGEVAPGQLVAVIRAGSDRWWRVPRSSFVVDLRSGSLRRIGHRLMPISGWWGWGDAHPVPDAGGVSSMLFLNFRHRLSRQKHLVMWDPATGELTELVRGRG